MPVPLVYDPAGHEVHPEAAAALKLPAEQLEHALCPDVAWYLPAEQEVHALLPVPVA